MSYLELLKTAREVQSGFQLSNPTATFRDGDGHRTMRQLQQDFLDTKYPLHYESLNQYEKLLAVANKCHDRNWTTKLENFLGESVDMANKDINQLSASLNLHAVVSAVDKVADAWIERYPEDLMLLLLEASKLTVLTTTPDPELARNGVTVDSGCSNRRPATYFASWEPDKIKNMNINMEESPLFQSGPKKVKMNAPLSPMIEYRDKKSNKQTQRKTLWLDHCLQVTTTAFEQLLKDSNKTYDDLSAQNKADIMDVKAHLYGVQVEFAMTGVVNFAGRKQQGWGALVAEIEKQVACRKSLSITSPPLDKYFDNS